MNELQTIRSASAVGAEIRALTQQFKYMTLVYGVEVGRRLTEAKEMLPYGEFGNWLKAETEFSSATASRFMKLHAEYGVLLEGSDEDVSTLKKVSVSNALRLLALPENERESFAEEHDVEHLSARELDKILAERDEAIKRAEEAEKLREEADARREEAEDVWAEASEKLEKYERYVAEEEKRLAGAVAPYEEKLAALKAENKELRERPVDVAVQIDEEAVKKAAEEAAEKADKKWGKKYADAEKQVKELQEEIKRRDEGIAPYEAKLSEMEAAGKRSEEEIAALRKQLAMSGAEVTAFKLRFDEWQKAYNLMLEALAVVPEDNREKLHAAVKAVLEGQVARA